MTEQEQVITELFEVINKKDTEIQKLKEFSEQVVALGEELKIQGFMIGEEKDNEICILRNQLQQCHNDLEFLKIENLHLNQRLSNINSQNMSFHPNMVSSVGCPTARLTCGRNMTRAGDALDEKIRDIPKIQKEKKHQEKLDKQQKNAEFNTQVENWRGRMRRGGKIKSIKKKNQKKSKNRLKINYFM